MPDNPGFTNEIVSYWGNGGGRRIAFACPRVGLHDDLIRFNVVYIEDEGWYHNDFNDYMEILLPIYLDLMVMALRMPAFKIHGWSMEGREKMAIWALVFQ